MSRLAAARAHLSVCIGKTGPRIAEQIQAAGGQARLCDSFEDAVSACVAAARSGDTVLLSPGCASWGMFEDYRQRGMRFAQLVTETASPKAGFA
jgi:UDP-N-acetylmuramoylalanine--D-glutamate ligase